MKIFISCSGKLSMEIGKVLRETLPMMLQTLQPFLAMEDVKLGDFWIKTIKDILDDSECAILCLTKENLSSAWIYFEAGIFSKANKTIIPLLIDISYKDLSKNPLSAYHAVRLEKKSMFSLIQTLNKISDTPLSREFLDKVFNVMWPIMDEKFQNTINFYKRK